MIVGVMGGCLLLVIAVVGALNWARMRSGASGGIKRIRFHNPVYRRTTDEEVDGGGLTIAQQQMLHHHATTIDFIDYTEKVRVY